MECLKNCTSKVHIWIDNSNQIVANPKIGSICLCGKRKVLEVKVSTLKEKV